MYSTYTAQTLLCHHSSLIYRRIWTVMCFHKVCPCTSSPAYHQVYVVKKKSIINQFFTAFKEPEPKYGSKEWKVHFFVSKLMLQIWKNYSNLFGTNIRMVKNPIISVYWREGPQCVKMERNTLLHHYHEFIQPFSPYFLHFSPL